MMSARFVALSSLMSLAASFSTETSSSPTWSIESTTSATTVVGVGASGGYASAAAAANGIGAFVEVYDGSSWSKDTLQAGLLLDSAITPDGKTIVASGTFPIFVSNDGGDTFTKVETLSGTSQSANVYGGNNDKIALVGTFIPAGTKEGVASVATSADLGKTWELSAPIPGGYGAYPRYGAFPSENVWYITSGIWGSDPAYTGEDSRSDFSLSSRFHFRNGTLTESAGTKGNPQAKVAVGTPTGWFGSISKTTDGGKTWEKVFSSDPNSDYWYFNSIACSSETTCVAVAEGDSPDGSYLTLAFTTVDGGNTWIQSFSSTEVGLSGAAYSAATGQFWILGTSKSGRNLTGQYRASTDGGKTFNLVQSLDNCFGLDLSFGSDDAGFSVCISSSGASAAVAVYA